MVVLAFLIPLAILVRDLARDRALTGAERDAASIARVIAGVAPYQGVAGAAKSLDQLEFLGVSVILDDGTVVGMPIPEGEDLSAARDGSAFSARISGGSAVYVPVVQSDQATIVRVFVPDSVIREGVVWSWVTLGLLGLTLIAIAIAVADRLGRSVVVPVRELSATAISLGEGDLSARVEPAGPEEIRDVGTEFNRLAERIGRLLQQERETSADLSHRLRTPLTAVRLDVEGLEEGERKKQVLEDLDELDRTVDFIIREARRPARQELNSGCDLGVVVAQRVAFWSALAEEQQREVTSRLVDRAIFVAIPASDAEAMMDALLGNVFAHTEDQVGFAVRIEDDGAWVTLTVADAGEGFPDRSVVERGESGAASTGLGLDIVRRTAESCGGTLTIGHSGEFGGARVDARLPTVPRPGIRPASNHGGRPAGR